MANNTSYLGDLKKTEAIIKLLNTPQAGRGNIWQKQLLNNLPTASFRSVNPQIFVAPDGFPYFQLFTPIPGENFTCFVLEQMIPFLLEQGVGVALNPSETGVDWVLTYGEIVNYSLNGEFYTNTDEPVKHHGDTVLAQGAVVSVPDETILPLETRNILKHFFIQNGINEPKTGLALDKKDESHIDLIFNVTAKDFPTEQVFRQFLQQLAWFLPKHYSFGGVEEQGDLQQIVLTKLE